ncbi:GAF and ANTAR domain-containing protein [Nocardioides sp.]|uniref:GAF and ANTAR domain-containing protein n=1 Tax=Nocardioides sp. TaxID=35761 RepID=UPI002ED4AB7B
MSEPDALEAVTEAAVAIGTQEDATAALEEIVRQARRCLPEFEHVSVSRVSRSQTLETLAATTDLAREFDAIQSEAREGPCVTASKEDEVVAVRHAPHEQRWPRYIGKAATRGLLSQLGVRLHSDTNGFVCLNLHSTTHEEIDAGSIGVAEHFAVHAGLALGHMQKAEQLHTAIGSRTLIGTAIGITMERFGMTQAEAFTYLVRQASEANRKVRVVASDLVEEVERTHAIRS